jgi:FixJ family two-component response regulator
MRASDVGVPAHFTIHAIFVGRDDADYRHLHCIFKMMNWQLARVQDLQHALKRAAAGQMTHLLYEHVPGDNRGWIEALDAVSALPNMPSFILTSPLGDERLWAEVLNRGGYDLLIQPYESLEVTRVVAAARKHSLRQNIELSAMAG